MSWKFDEIDGDISAPRSKAPRAPASEATDWLDTFIDELIDAQPSAPALLRFAPTTRPAGTDFAELSIGRAASQVLGQVLLGYSPVIDPVKGVIATRLTVVPLRAGLGNVIAHNQGWGVYVFGGSALMAGIVREVTGRHIDEYAREALFQPLGISDFHWKKSPAGVPDTEGGVYLSARDLAKIGELYLADGVWNGRRVLPEGWVRDATSRHVTGVGPGWDYGYQWWLTSRGGTDIWAGRGFGGQLLLVIPATKTVAVVTAWNVFGGRFAGNIFDAVVDAALSGR